MCTVLYLPGKEKLYFVSLRDESPNRSPASIPSIWEMANIKFIAPKDEEGGGTWIGTNALGTVIVLLNGGFENHKKSNYYFKSRGIIVTELLASLRLVDDWSNMNLNQIEPFTLLIWSDPKLYQLVWDGKDKYKVQLKSTEPYLFSSSTLYDVEAKKTRQILFQNWIANNPSITPSTVLDFFMTFPDSENGFIINRSGQIKTLSYSFIELVKERSAAMHYYNLQNSDRNTIIIELLKPGIDETRYQQA